MCAQPFVFFFLFHLTPLHVIFLHLKSNFGATFVPHLYKVKLKQQYYHLLRTEAAIWRHFLYFTSDFTPVMHLDEWIKMIARNWWMCSNRNLIYKEFMHHLRKLKRGSLHRCWKIQLNPPTKMRSGRVKRRMRNWQNFKATLFYKYYYKGLYFGIIHVSKACRFEKLKIKYFSLWCQLNKTRAYFPSAMIEFKTKSHTL